MIGPDDIVLFQGDSITDAGRPRHLEGPNYAHGLGHGYVLHIAGALLSHHAGSNLKIYNRGVSGDTVVNMAARWQKDTLDLKPTVLSVLIGINDNWHGPDTDRQRHVPVEKYQALYRELLTQARAQDPQLRLILCEPFALPAGDVTEDWFDDLNRRREAVQQLAEEFAATFVAFQQMFNDAMNEAPPDFWAGDGYHPSAAGHYRMAQAWLKAAGVHPGDNKS